MALFDSRSQLDLFFVTEVAAVDGPRPLYLNCFRFKMPRACRIVRLCRLFMAFEADPGVAECWRAERVPEISDNLSYSAWSWGLILGICTSIADGCKSGVVKKADRPAIVETGSNNSGVFEDGAAWVQRLGWFVFRGRVPRPGPDSRSGAVPSENVQVID
jgi:hypothetical protein